uniref:Uncharacterized protein n=1 Tax=Anguilla anguilla TaxID=7936 RepID=A0A0E9SP39_ANGAN
MYLFSNIIKHVFHIHQFNTHRITYITTALQNIVLSYCIRTLWIWSVP